MWNAPKVGYAPSPSAAGSHVEQYILSKVTQNGLKPLMKYMFIPLKRQMLYAR